MKYMYSYKEELYATPSRVRLALNEPEHPALSAADSLVFCGCGTSFYLGGQCAKICTAYGRKARAAEAVELLSGSAEIDVGSVYVFISRSGNSEETVRAQALAKKAGAATFYLGCCRDSRLAAACDACRVLPYGNETLILETYSYYVQLVAALRCCGIAIDPLLPELIAHALAQGERCFTDLLRGRRLTRIISLAAPFFRPHNREMMLKDGEITQLPSEEWGILEFRHGPRSWCDETTLIHILPERSTQVWDAAVAAELAGYGCPVIWYGDAPPANCFCFDASYCCAEQTLAFGAFHTALAVAVGRERNTCPENLRHIVHNVKTL